MSTQWHGYCNYINKQFETDKNMEARKKAISEVLKCIETETLVGIWNEYCSEENMDDYIWENDECNLEEMFSGPSAVSDALRAACYGDYNFTDRYVVLNAYGNLKSYDIYDVEEQIDFDALAEYIMDNDCREIQDVWIEDIHSAFEDFFNEKFTDVSIDEDYDLSSWNLLTDEWNDIAQEVLDEIKDNEDETEYDDTNSEKEES